MKIWSDLTPVARDRPGAEGKRASFIPRIWRNGWPPRLLKACRDSADQRSGNLDGTAFPVPSPAADEMQEVPQWGNMTR